jgi:hypothetical protein
MLEPDEFSRIGITELSHIAGISRGMNYNNDMENMYKGAIGGGDFQNYLKKVTY